MSSLKQFDGGEEKKAFVQQTFSKIAKRYDVMNTLLSFNQDVYWRSFAIKKLELKPGDTVLDMACGTCSMTLEAYRQEPNITVTGLDFNKDMLAIGEERVLRAKVAERTTLVEGDAMDLPFCDSCFHGAMSAFALRNVPDVSKALLEMKRVVKPGGKVVTLELAKPSAMGFKQLYYLYFDKILPFLGVLGVRNTAYEWLPESLRRYPHQSEITELFTSLGYKNVVCYELTGGIVAVHVAEV